MRTKRMGGGGGRDREKEKGREKKKVVKRAGQREGERGRDRENERNTERGERQAGFFFFNLPFKLLVFVMVWCRCLDKPDTAELNIYLIKREPS